MPQYQMEDAPRAAVLVSGRSEAALRRFLSRYVKPAFGLQKTQWRMCYRERYALVVLSRPLRAGQDADAVYGPHAGSAALVLACLEGGLPGSGRAATQAWLKAQGYSPVVELELELDLGGSESEIIDQGAEVVNFINLNCPWRTDGIEDIDVYLEQNNKPFWA